MTRHNDKRAVIQKAQDKLLHQSKIRDKKRQSNNTKQTETVR